MVAQAVEEAGGDEGLVLLDRGPVLADRRARGGERDGTEHVRAAGLVPGRAGRPAGAALGDLGGGAAAGEVGTGGVEPVAAPGEHSGAEGGVHLVTGERDPVDVEGAEVEGAVRDVLGRVEQHPGAVLTGDRDEALDRPDLTGDVGRGRQHDEGLAGASRGAPRERGERVCRSTSASRGDPGTGRRTVSRRLHGSRVAWCSEENTTTEVSRGSDRASRLTESVVLRVKTTTSSSRAPTKRATSSRAAS